MSNKTQLQANNLMLNTFINRINAAKDVAASLPEAGSGLETCQVNIADGNATVYYIDATGSSQSIPADTYASSYTIECAKNSYIFLTTHMKMSYRECTQIYRNVAQRLALYYVYGDATIG